MRVLVPAAAPLEELAPLPAGVELVHRGESPARMAVLDAELVDHLDETLATPGLEIVQSIASGVDWLLPHAAASLTVANGAGIHDVAVAEWCVATILAMRRRLPELHVAQQHGAWDTKPAEEAEDLEGATVLIVGHGSIGRALETRLAPFGARFERVARRERPGVRPLEDARGLAARADVVVVLLPLRPETERAIDARFLDAMRPGALLVNAGRGRLVDTAALVERLRAGRLRAALDVTDPEPLPPGHPLWETPNTLITPHVAGTVRDWERRAWRFVGEQLRRLAAGEPLANVVRR